MSFFFDPRPIRKFRRKSTARLLAQMLKRKSSPTLAPLPGNQRPTGKSARYVPRRRKQRPSGYRIAAAPSPRRFRVT